MIFQHKIDLQLTVLEFEGLVEQLQYHANYYLNVGHSVKLADISEDDLLLGHYYLTVVRPIEQRGTWQKRNAYRRLGPARRYAFRVNFLLARVLFRGLYAWPYPLGNPQQALLNQLHQLLINNNALPIQYRGQRAWSPLPVGLAITEP